MTKEKEKVELLIRILKHVREKPGMYTGSMPGAMEHFLNGLDFASAVLDISHVFEKTFFQVIRECGWDVTPSLTNELSERGLNESQIDDALVVLRIKTWEKIAAQLEE